MATKGFWHQNTEYNAEDLRVLAQALLPSSGVFSSTDLAVTAPGSTIAVAAGKGVCTHSTGSTGTGGGRFIVSNSASANATKWGGGGTSWTPAAGGNSRIDNVFVALTDTALDASSDTVTVYFQTGTEIAGNGASIPSLPASTTLLHLATVRSYNGGSITVTDRRKIIGQVNEPAGVVKSWAATGAPAGYLACDGSAVNRTVYADLFAAIGTTWGAGDGSSTFNLPDLRGRTLIGAGTGGGLTTRTLAAAGGEEVHVLTGAESPPHAHGINGGASNFLISGVGSGAGYEGSTFASPEVAMTDSFGSGAAHNNMQPYAVINYVIRY